MTTLKSAAASRSDAPLSGNSHAILAPSDSVEQELKQRTPGRRILALDAVRGLAAFSVIWLHFHLMFYSSNLPWYRRMLVGGHPVTLFFVLSGYVLSLPYWRGRQLAYGPYLVRRFFRIYVPYAAAVVLALLGASHLLYAQLPLQPWFYWTWHTALTPGLIAAQFFTISISPAINTAFWSLRYEMEMSLIFPFVCWTMARLRPLGSFVVTLILGKLGFILFNRLDHPLQRELGNTLIQGSSFLLGGLLAWKAEAVGTLYRKTPTWAKALFAIATIAVYQMDKDVIAPFACCGILVFAQHSGISRWLDTAIPEYLGRISYSLYLVHGTVLWATTILLYGKVPVFVIGMIFATVSFLIAHLMCMSVEEPAMRLGKRLSDKLAAPRQRVGA
jgi:peptidoglycan/LPS O-acetylase OafA/YrhL